MSQPIKSPINYTGNKYRLLNQLKQFFPKKTGVFIDLFCGGATVGFNVDAEKIILIDNNKRVIDLLKNKKSTTPPSPADATSTHYLAIEKRLPAAHQITLASSKNTKAVAISLARKLSTTTSKSTILSPENLEITTSIPSTYSLTTSPFVRIVTG